MCVSVLTALHNMDRLAPMTVGTSVPAAMSASRWTVVTRNVKVLASYLVRGPCVVCNARMSVCLSVRLPFCRCVCAITTSTILRKLFAVLYRYAYILVYIFLLGFVNIYLHVYIHTFMYLCTVVFLLMKHAHKYADNDPLMNQRFPNLPHSPSGTTTKKLLQVSLLPYP